MPLSRTVANFNRRVTNRVSRHVAGWLPGFGIVRHIGRRTGAVYETPVNVFKTDGGFAFALTYGRADWVRNVLDGGVAQVRTRRRTYMLTNPRVIESAGHPDLPPFVRPILRMIDVTEELRTDAEKVSDTPVSDTFP